MFMMITPEVTVLFFASYATIVPKEKCFFQLPGQNLSNGVDVQFVFKSNSADAAGSMLFGGAIDNCKLTGTDSYNSGEVFDKIFHNNGTIYNTTSNVSSDPIQICPCEHNQLNCSETQYYYPRTVYPGEIFQDSVVAVGQRNGTVNRGFICSELDHLICCHLPCSTLRRRSGCSWVHLCLHSICNIHRNPCLSAGKCYWHHSIP